MNVIDRLNKIAHLLPPNVLDDINTRITDWISSGGDENSPYMQLQLRYAENVIKQLDEDLPIRPEVSE